MSFRQCGARGDRAGCAIFCEAMRRVGEMLRETERAAGGRPTKTPAEKEGVFNDNDDPPTLAGIGVWQIKLQNCNLIAVPEEYRRGQRIISDLQ